MLTVAYQIKMRQASGDTPILTQTQIRAGAKAGEPVLEISFEPCCSDWAGPNAYRVSIVWDDGGISPMTFIITADSITTNMRSNDTKFTWRRTPCPQQQPLERGRGSG
jgi:hypothetical protein